ncbi:MAG TPA: pitrilysin family protein [Verrucomicrobiae bacterium]|nr:pitrilysin family protein [Verrucomicrobiae bacterium]
MRFWPLICSVLLMQSGFAQTNTGSKFFPYPWTIDTLSNGLSVVTVPTEHKNLVALYFIVRTGSRNEVEKGKSGFAHFFEHMMFRGSDHFTAEQREAVMKKAGAENNAYTADDRTVFHALFSAKDLDKIMEIEADRFEYLKYSEADYKTEALAVLGEYNKNSADPAERLFEALRDRAFSTHTYKHTTMGFIQDIKDMPNQFEYSRRFYKRYYRPEYTTVLLVGDIRRDRALDLTKKYLEDWERGGYKPDVTAEPPQKQMNSASVDWPSPTLPYVVVAYHGPAFSERKKDKASLDFVVPIGFGENSELYQKLVLKEQKVDMLEPVFEDHVDPELFAVMARVKEDKDVNYVRDEIIKTFERFAKEPVTQEKLDETRSHIRYSTALTWTSANSIAGFLAPYVSLGGSPQAVDRLFALYQQVTPKDIEENARRYFVPENSTVVTLATKAKEKSK